MKPSYYPIIRIIFTLILGILMIVIPQSILYYIAVVVGLMLIIPGAIQLIRYLIICCKRNQRDRRYHPMKFPILATLAIIVGGIIIAFSNFFIEIFSLMFAVLLIIGGLYEIVMIIRSQRKNTIGYYVMPALLTLLGIFILANPLNLLPNLIVMIFGVGAVLYSINEIIYLARIER